MQSVIQLYGTYQFISYLLSSALIGVGGCVFLRPRRL